MSLTRRMMAIVAIEFTLAIRNRWILLSTLALLMFALALGFLGAGSGGQLKADVLSLTAASLATLSVYLIPLIGLLLSYDTISGEIERGTLALVIATPASRGELLMGKFLGHLGIMAAAIAVGYGIAAAALVAVHGGSAAGLLAWVRLALTCLMLGGVFIALGMFISIRATRTGTAAAVVIGCWLLLVVLYDLGLLAGLVLDNGGYFTKTLFPYFVLGNPADAFRLFNLAALEAATPVAGIDGLARTMPFPPSMAIVVLASWLAAALFAGLYSIRRVQP